MILASASGAGQAQPAAQGGGVVAGNAEERRLAFVEARVGHEEAEKELERARELQQNGLISQAELEREDARLRLADIAMRRAWLRMALADPEVVLRAARKYQQAGSQDSQGGGVRVEIELVARWSVGLNAAVQEDVDGSSVELPALEGVSNAVVSLKTTRGYSSEGVLLEPTIVSVPYEHRIPLLRFDEPVLVDFGLLLPDVQELLVQLRYNDRIHERQVLLGKRAGAHGPLLVRADQITLDAELGTEAVFELSLERFDDSSISYEIEAEDLPPEVALQAADPDSGAVLSQLFFPEGVTDRKLQLKLTMPARPTASVSPDRAIPFSVLFARAGGAGGSTSVAAGRLDLAVIPRGAPISTSRLRTSITK